VSKKIQRRDPNPGRKALDGAQREIPLAPLDPSHVSAVHAQGVGKVLLAETSVLAVAT